MSIQEAALHGDLVLYLRDRVAKTLAGEDCSVDELEGQLDAIIREWFFTQQDELHGCAPRDLIWAEQKGAPNPVHPERLDTFFVDDCPICQAEFEKVKAAIESGEDPGWHWYYDSGGYPLIAHYDPEGWDVCWAEEEAAFEEWQPTEGNRKRSTPTSQRRSLRAFPGRGDRGPSGEVCGPDAAALARPSPPSRRQHAEGSLGLPGSVAPRLPLPANDPRRSAFAPG